MKSRTGISLALMMFLEYFIWGSWYVTMSKYMLSEHSQLNSSGTQIGLAYAALSMATMISPFFIGMIADRFFSAQRIMGLLHIIGAVVLLLLTKITNNTVFIIAILAYSLVYMPTIALSNSVAFRQMTNPDKQFPWIRVFGTIGWIVAGLLITILDISTTSSTFIMASCVSLLLGIYSFFLPDTPPSGAKDVSAAKALGTEAFVMFRNKPYLIFFIAAILVCIPLSFYYGWAAPFLTDAGMTKVEAKMTMGQVSEAVFILAIPFLFKRIGVKNMLLLGMTAWILRYVCFAFGDINANAWMLYAGIILHGICYDFFFVTGYMYTEMKAGPKIKNAAQGLFTFATYGMGMLIGQYFSGYIADHYSAGKVLNWEKIWFVPTYIAIGVLIYFILFFKEKREIQVTK